MCSALNNLPPPDEGGQAHTVSPSCPHPPMNACRHGHHQRPPFAFETKLGLGGYYAQKHNLGAASLAKKASFVLCNELVIKLRIGNTLLFLNSFTIQTQPSWPYAMNITAGFCLKGCPKGNRMKQNTGNLLQFINRTNK